MNIDKVIRAFDDQMCQNIVPFNQLMQEISSRMVNVYAYENILNDREALRLTPVEDDDGYITVEMYLATTNTNGTEKRELLNDTNLGLLFHYAPQAIKFAKEIINSLSST
jgi:hypothetical protein